MTLTANAAAWRNASAGSATESTGRGAVAMSKPSHLSLFSGIGGLDLAAEWAGFETVGQCEWADYPCKVLERHWPNVPRWRDIHDMTGDDFYERTGRRTVDIISGGFPCQPFSVAGKQKGKEDDRYLWPQMCRVITELEPRWVVGENVPGILRIAAADVVQDLERLGFECVVFDFEAAAVGAPHRRERVAFVAHRVYNGQLATEITGSVEPRSQYGPQGADATGKFAGLCERGGRTEVVAGSGGIGRQGNRADREQIGGASTAARATASSGTVHDTVRRGCDRIIGWRDASFASDGRGGPAEPDVGRVAHGVPSRVDRLRCLGNAVVPQQFYPIFRAIRAEIDRERS